MTFDEREFVFHLNEINSVYYQVPRRSFSAHSSFGGSANQSFENQYLRIYWYQEILDIYFS